MNSKKKKKKKKKKVYIYINNRIFIKYKLSLNIYK